MDTQEPSAGEIFGSELYAAIVRQSIADAQHTQNQLDRFCQNKEAQLTWLRDRVLEFAYDQDSKRVQEKLFAIVQASYQIKSEDVPL